MNCVNILGAELNPNTITVGIQTLSAHSNARKRHCCSLTMQLKYPSSKSRLQAQHPCPSSLIFAIMDLKLGYFTVLSGSTMWPLTDKWYSFFGWELLITGRTDPSGFGTPWIGFMIRFRFLASSLVKGPNICERECHFNKTLESPTKVAGSEGGLRGKPLKSNLDSDSDTPISIPSFRDVANDFVKSELNHCSSSLSHEWLSYLLTSALLKSLTCRFWSFCFQNWRVCVFYKRCRICVNYYIWN